MSDTTAPTGDLTLIFHKAAIAGNFAEFASGGALALSDATIGKTAVLGGIMMTLSIARAIRHARIIKGDYVVHANGAKAQAKRVAGAAVDIAAGFSLAALTPAGIPQFVLENAGGLQMFKGMCRIGAAALRLPRTTPA